MDLENIYSQLIDRSELSFNFNMAGETSECILSMYDKLLQQDFDDDIPENGIKLGTTREESEKLKSELRIVRNDLEKQIQIINEDYENSIKTRAEAFMYNAKLLHTINNYNGTVLEDHGEHARNYPDFDIDTFKSYIYWRTKVRNGKYIKAPLCFIFMYLRELCNFAEKETPQQTWNILSTLLNSYSMMDNCEKIVRYIENSMIDFAVLYGIYINGSMDFLVKKLDEKYADEMIRYKISTGDFKDTFEYFSKYSTYKITKSKFYTDDNIHLIQKCFPIVMRDLYEYFKRINIPVFNLWVGELRDYQYQIDATIVNFNNKYINERIISINDIFQLDIKKDLIMTKAFRPYENDKGMSIYHRYYSVVYILQCFENELRIKTGYKHKLRPNFNDIEKMFLRYKTPIYKDVMKVYLSDEFYNVIRNAIDKVIN